MVCFVVFDGFGGPGGGFFIVPLLLLLSRNHRQDHQNHHQDHQNHQKLQSRPFKQTITSPYAHMEIVVVLIVVKKLGFWVITRDHGSFDGRHQVEILPTDLPELFKPARDLLEPTKTTRTTTTRTTKTPRLFNF